MFRKIVASLALTAVVTTTASAMTVKEFKRFTVDEQSIYIGAAVSMLTYKYAVDGDTRRARCLQNWYFGEPGKEAPGPRAVRVEIAVAEERGPEKFQIDGIILGLTDQVCAPTKPASAPTR